MKRKGKPKAKTKGVHKRDVMPNNETTTSRNTNQSNTANATRRIDEFRQQMDVKSTFKSFRSTRAKHRSHSVQNNPSISISVAPSRTKSPVTTCCTVEMSSSQSNEAQTVIDGNEVGGRQTSDTKVESHLIDEDAIEMRYRKESLSTASCSPRKVEVEINETDEADRDINEKDDASSWDSIGSVQRSYIRLINYNKLQYFYLGALLYSVINIMFLLKFIATRSGYSEKEATVMIANDDQQVNQVRHGDPTNMGAEPESGWQDQNGRLIEVLYNSENEAQMSSKPHNGMCDQRLGSGDHESYFDRNSAWILVLVLCPLALLQIVIIVAKFLRFNSFTTSNDPINLERTRRSPCTRSYLKPRLEHSDSCSHSDSNLHLHLDSKSSFTGELMKTRTGAISLFIRNLEDLLGIILSILLLLLPITLIHTGLVLGSSPTSSKKCDPHFGNDSSAIVNNNRLWHGRDASKWLSLVILVNICAFILPQVLASNETTFSNILGCPLRWQKNAKRANKLVNRMINSTIVLTIIFIVATVYHRCYMSLARDENQSSKESLSSLDDRENNVLSALLRFNKRTGKLFLISTSVLLVCGQLRRRLATKLSSAATLFKGANELIEAKVSLEQQRQQQETLLLSVLPAYVAEQVKRTMVKKMGSLDEPQQQQLVSSGTMAPIVHETSGANNRQMNSPQVPFMAAPNATCSSSPVNYGRSLTSPGITSNTIEQSRLDQTNSTGGTKSQRSSFARLTRLSSSIAFGAANLSDSILSNKNPASSSKKTFLANRGASVNQESSGSQRDGVHSHSGSNSPDNYRQQRSPALQEMQASSNDQPATPVTTSLPLPMASIASGSAGQQQQSRRGFNELYISTYNNVSLLYGDIVGFTSLCTQLSSSQLVSVLNNLFSYFDHLADRHRIMRIKILGDCYYGVAGIPEFAVTGTKSSPRHKKLALGASGADDHSSQRGVGSGVANRPSGHHHQQDNHAISCVNMGLDMIQYIKCLNIERGGGGTGSTSAIDREVSKGANSGTGQLPAHFELNMRIGIHTGHIHSGVIGLKKWQFDVWSNDVSIAMHCESSGVAGRVQVTDATVQHLHDAFTLEPAPSTSCLAGSGSHRRDSFLADKDIRTYLIKERKLAANEFTDVRGSHDSRGMTGRGQDPRWSKVPATVASMSDETAAGVDHEQRIREATIGTIRQTLLSGETPATSSMNALGLAFDHNDMHPLSLSFKDSLQEQQYSLQSIALGPLIGELFALLLLFVIVLFTLLDHNLLFMSHNTNNDEVILIASLLISFIILIAIARLIHRSSKSPSSASSSSSPPKKSSTKSLGHSLVKITKVSKDSASEKFKTSLIDADDELLTGGRAPGSCTITSQPTDNWFTFTSSPSIPLADGQVGQKAAKIYDCCLYSVSLIRRYNPISLLNRNYLHRRQTQRKIVNHGICSWMILTIYFTLILVQIYLLLQVRVRHCQSHQGANNDFLATNQQYVVTYQLTVIILLISLDLIPLLLNYKLKSFILLAICLSQIYRLIASSDFNMTQCNSNAAPLFLLQLLAKLFNLGQQHEQQQELHKQSAVVNTSSELHNMNSSGTQQDSEADLLIYWSNEVLLLVWSIWSLAHGRQMEYSMRCNFLWRNRLNVDHEELEYISGINKVLLENILPSHVVQHYLSASSTGWLDQKQRLAPPLSKPVSKGQRASLAANPTATLFGSQSFDKQLDRIGGNAGGGISMSNNQLVRMSIGNVNRYLEQELYHEQHDSVAVMFASIPHFYEFYDESDISKQGLGCIALLNEIICDFDKLLLKNKFSRIEKIKTIGSTYMAAAGLRPNHQHQQLSSRNSTASQISHLPPVQQQVQQHQTASNSGPMMSTGACDLSSSSQLSLSNRLELLTGDQLNKFNTSQQKMNLICMIQFATSLMSALNGINKQSFQVFKLRVGVNTGPVIAGIIGAQRPFYDIWGDCVNIASRMESLGEVGRIQVEERTAKLLMECLCTDNYSIQKRGHINVKGKGGMVTYFVDKVPQLQHHHQHQTPRQLSHTGGNAAGGARAQESTQVEAQYASPSTRKQGLSRRQQVAMVCSKGCTTNPDQHASAAGVDDHTMGQKSGKRKQTEIEKPCNDMSNDADGDDSLGNHAAEEFDLAVN